MKKEAAAIIALIILLFLVLGGRWYSLAASMPEGRIPAVEPSVNDLKVPVTDEQGVSQTMTVPVETYVYYESQKQYADPFRYVRYLLTAPNVEGVTFFFEASSEGTDNRHIVKAVGELSYILGYKKKGVTTRPVDTFRKMLLQANILGTTSSPVIYFKTPNVGGKTTRIVVAPGMIILESKNYEDITTLALVVRQVVIG